MGVEPRPVALVANALPQGQGSESGGGTGFGLGLYSDGAGDEPDPTAGDHLVGLAAKASSSRAEDPGFESRDFFGSSHTSDLNIGTPVGLPCQAPGVIGSALGLVGPMSVYCDWVR